MKKPNTHPEWANEAFNSYNYALGQLEKGLSPADDKYNLFRHAPFIAANNRNIKRENEKLVMLEFTVREIERDFIIDENAQINYLFHFILAYIHSQVHGGFITEFEADSIMHYINENYQLFEDA